MSSARAMSRLSLAAPCALWIAATAAALVQAQAQAPADTPPELTEARVVALAVARNPGLRAAVLEMRRARLAVTSEQARYDPVFIADAGITHTETPVLLLSGTSESRVDDASMGVGVGKRFAFGTEFQLRLGGAFRLTDSDIPLGMSGAGALGPAYGMSLRLSAAHPLLRGAGRDVGEAELRAARVRRSAAESARDRVASELLRDVLTAYWELWFSDAAVHIEEQSLEVSRRQRDDALARVRTGSLAPANALTFETSVATSEEQVLAARLERERRTLELRERLGLAGQRSVLGTPSVELPPLPGPPPGDVAQAALDQSLELRERESGVELARVQARTADDPLRPRLDLEAFVQTEGLGNDDVAAAAEGLGTLGAVSAHLSLVYEMPFTGTRRQAEAARARLAVEVSEAQLSEARQGVLAQVEIALAQHSAGQRRLELAQQTVGIAERRVQAEQARFETGDSTPLAVVEAEDALRAAQLRVARARTDVLQTSLTLDHLTGRLLARHAAVSNAAQ